MPDTNPSTQPTERELLLRLRTFTITCRKLIDEMAVTFRCTNRPDADQVLAAIINRLLELDRIENLKRTTEGHHH